MTTRDFGLDLDVVGEGESLVRAVRRRVAGRYPVDPFGLDPHVCDLVAPAFTTLVRVTVEHGDRIPTEGPAVLVANRGLGVAEPAALCVAVRETVQRRLRVVGAPNVVFAGALSRRLGGISATEADVGAALRAGHLVAVPLSPTWLRTGAGTPPLELVQAMTPYPVVPVAVVPAGPFGTPVAWQVRVGQPISVDRSYAPGDPLAAADLGEMARAAVEALLAGHEPANALEPGAVAW
jgi:1-acyl-sn-glycerol-3-phosphate acyltransferase